jgi:hypothetical protein
MSSKQTKTGTITGIIGYFRNLPDQSPYWRFQAVGVGMILIVLIAGAVLTAILSLSSVFGGGTISYTGAGSPGPVTFSHYNHMWFQKGKYKDCKVCHEGIFASQKRGTYTIRALQDTPPVKYRIGRDTSTLAFADNNQTSDAGLVTYEVPRACATCATGNCHDGKESFSRLECLKCHQSR